MSTINLRDVKFLFQNNVYHQVYGSASAVLNIQNQQTFSNPVGRYLQLNPTGLAVIKMVNEQVSQAATTGDNSNANKAIFQILA